MTARPDLDDWLARSATMISPPCAHCGQPASFEAWHPDRPEDIRPLCQAHAETTASDPTLTGIVVQLAGA